jgi:hypothetical protein
MEGFMGKETIPDFTNCVRDKNGDIWCFDKTTGNVCRVIPVVSNTVPQDVCLELLQAASKKKDN